MNNLPKTVGPFASMAGYRKTKSGLLLPGTCALHGGIGFNCQCCEEESSSSGSSDSGESSVGSFSDSISNSASGSSSSNSTLSSSSSFINPDIECPNCIGGVGSRYMAIFVPPIDANCVESGVWNDEGGDFIVEYVGYGPITLGNPGCLWEYNSEDGEINLRFWISEYTPYSSTVPVGIIYHGPGCPHNLFGGGISWIWRSAASLPTHCGSYTLTGSTCNSGAYRPDPATASVL